MKKSFLLKSFKAEKKYSFHKLHSGLKFFHDRMMGFFLFSRWTAVFAQCFRKWFCVRVFQDRTSCLLFIKIDAFVLKHLKDNNKDDLVVTFFSFSCSRTSCSLLGVLLHCRLLPWRSGLPSLGLTPIGSASSVSVSVVSPFLKLEPLGPAALEPHTLGYSGSSDDLQSSRRSCLQ